MGVGVRSLDVSLECAQGPVSCRTEPRSRERRAQQPAFPHPTGPGTGLGEIQGFCIGTWPSALSRRPRCQQAREAAEESRAYISAKDT